MRPRFPLLAALSYSGSAYTPTITSISAAQRTAASTTQIGGGLLLLFSFLAMIVGGLGGLWFFFFGVLPAIGILNAGSKMGKAGADLSSLANHVYAYAGLSLLSFGGFLIGAIVSFVGASQASSAARFARPTPPNYGYQPAPPPQYSPPPNPYAPAWNQPTWAPPPPPPPVYARPAPSNPSFPYAGYGPAAPPPQAPMYTPFPQPPAPPPPPPPRVVVQVPPRPAPTTPAPWGLAPPPPAAPAVPAPLAAQPAAAAPAAARPAKPLTPLDHFLAQDANRSFDLEALNALDFGELKRAIEADRSKRQAAFEQASTLLERLHSDIADLDAVDDILRDRTVLWYRDSPKIPDWTDRQTARWAGLVAETRTAGGARTSPLLARLAELRTATAPFQGPARKALADFRKRGQDEAKPASSEVAAQVVQVVLDDLAASPRSPGSATPLLRLSELANKVTPAEANKTLAALFKTEPTGPFVILHPSRFPEFDFVLIRPPPPRATGAAVAYEMLTSPADQALPTAAAASVVPAGFAAQADAIDITSDLWSRPSVGDAGWAAALAEFERSRERLPPPPGDFRRLPPYFELRKLLIANADLRRTFLAVKWRGKPPGMALLANLLTERSLAPEFETDAEYLEAELSDLERGDANWKPATPEWTIAPGVKVTRVGDHGGFEYKVA